VLVLVSVSVFVFELFWSEFCCSSGKFAPQSLDKPIYKRRAENENK
jgi:hypothetical protein